MDFELTPKQAKWRDEVRRFLAENITNELREELWTTHVDEKGPELREIRRKIGERGWYGLNWPEEFGGLGLSPIEQQILIDEFENEGIAAFDLTVTSVAPMIMRYGTEKNKADWLPGIARGEVTCAVGYSEANAGTDLANLETRAELIDGQWIINGSKLWNSRAHRASHEWLCVRTDPSAPKHEGISVIIVPTDAAGVQIEPLVTWVDNRTNQTFFTDVRVPEENLIGEVNQGWSYITGALNLERGSIASAARLRVAFDALVDLCTRGQIDGVRLADDPLVRRRLAELDADLEIAKLLNLETASLLEEGEIPTIVSSEAKVFHSELRAKLADWGMQILGMYGQLDWHDEEAPLRGHLERLYREAPLVRFGGGTNEVLRDVIAQRGHGLPSYGRSRK
jgi:3-oxocholest-4-en-26-oyl-CoA dehydrogenase alpha subunit